MQGLLKWVMIMMISTIVFAGEVSDSVTFNTVQNAPTGFTSWVFYWSMPEIDPDATLEYIVLQPDGDEYYRMTVPGTTPAGQGIRSDFYEGFAGGNPEVLYGTDIQIMFTVDKGTIQFLDDASYHFEFTETIDAIR